MGWSDDYLEHHGILGQKWGVRRFENKNGTLTPAGRKRYDTDENGNYKKVKFADTAEGKKSQAQVQSAKNDYNKAKRDVMYYRNFGIYDKASEEKFNKASGMLDLRKKQKSDAKAKMQMKERSEAGKKVGKHEQVLIDKYKEKGMSQEEAEVAAFKRVKLEKTLAIAGAVTVAAATAYGAKKYHDYVTDEVLKVGKTSMKRVASSDSKDLHDTFYAAFGKGDSNKYVGMYGTQMKTQGKSNIYQKTIDLKEDIKIASDKNAKQTMGEVMRKTSPENRREILDGLKQMNDAYQKVPMLRDSKQGRMINKGLHDIAAGRYDTKEAYDAFNFHMTGGNQSKIYGEFKQALKDKGYSGIKDRNDMKYSGYNAKTARIIFDTSKVKVSDVRKLNNNEINSKNMKETMKMAMKALSKTGAAGIALTGAGVAIDKSARNKENTKAIADYKKEHPNTKLSNDEILENYYGGK